jgi:hypothetical protein
MAGMYSPEPCSARLLRLWIGGETIFGWHVHTISDAALEGQERVPAAVASVSGLREGPRAAGANVALRRWELLCSRRGWGKMFRVAVCDISNVSRFVEARSFAVKSFFDQ